MIDQEVASLKAQIAELQEQLAFWIGEGDQCHKTVEEQEWLTLAALGPEGGRTKQQDDRLRELGRFIMESDVDYWKSRAAKAEAELRQVEIDGCL